MMKIQKMIKDPGENNELPNKQEGGTSDHADKHQRRTRQWSSLSNPRIVRVSRAFGGKDRHSKVSTVRGLRDRRVRLSVPTAIQLYDLQDKLHLNQPSKVVDWLIDAAQQEIDKLPPLPLIPASFIQFPQPYNYWASSSAADAVNDEDINTSTDNGLQSFSFNADPVLSSNNFAHEDIAASFSKFRGITKDHIDAMPYMTSYHQWDHQPSNATSGAAENSSQVGSTPHEFYFASALSSASRSLMPAGSQFMNMPTMPYVTNYPNNFQWNSSGSNATVYSNINFIRAQYVNHDQDQQQYEEQQEDSIRESSRQHAGDGSNTASFF